MKIVLLPGLDGTGLLFESLIAALPKSVDPLVMSYPLSELSYSELMEYVVNQLPEEEYVLVGESFSGYIAHQIALSNPKNLKCVIFVASFLTNPRPQLLGFISKLPSSIFSLKPPTFVMKQFLLGENVSQQTLHVFKGVLNRLTGELIAYRLKQIASLQEKSPLCEVKALYIQAEEDRLIPSKVVDEFHASYRYLEVRRLQGPHFILQSQPEQSAKVIIEKIRKK